MYSLVIYHERSIFFKRSSISRTLILCISRIFRSSSRAISLRISSVSTFNCNSRKRNSISCFWNGLGSGAVLAAFGGFRCRNTIELVCGTASGIVFVTIGCSRVWRPLFVVAALIKVPSALRPFGVICSMELIMNALGTVRVVLAVALRSVQRKRKQLANVIYILTNANEWK